MAFHETILGIAQSNNWLLLGINLLLTTLVGGLVIAALVWIAGKEWGEGVHPARSFLLVFVITLINYFGVLAFLSPFFPGALSLLLPILVWLVLTKVFFGEMRWIHVIVVGIIGWILSIFIIPLLISWVWAYIPLGR